MAGSSSFEQLWTKTVEQRSGAQEAVSKAESVPPAPSTPAQDAAPEIVNVPPAGSQFGVDEKKEGALQGDEHETYSARGAEPVEEKRAAPEEVFIRQEPRSKPKQKPDKARGRPAAQENSTCEIRGVPKSLVQMAKAVTPDASNTKAVAAFLYAHRDPDMQLDFSDVPDDVKALSEKYGQIRLVQQLDENVYKMLDKLRGLEKSAELMRFVMTTLIMNANGLLGKHVSSGAGIDYTPPDFDLVFKELAAHSEKYWQLMRRRDGRPMR